MFANMLLKVHSALSMTFGQTAGVGSQSSPATLVARRNFLLGR